MTRDDALSRGVAQAGERLGFVLPDLLEALLTNVADAFYVVDHDGHVAYANPAAVALLGYNDEHELLGRPSHATIHHTRPDGTPFPVEECPMLRPRVTGETVRVDEDWFIRRDQSMFPVAYSSAALSTPDGWAAVVAFRDVSERRVTEEALRREAVERTRAEEVRASRARLMQAADTERARLGRDLHDGAQQRLLHIVLLLQRLESGHAPHDAARALLQQTVAEVRGALGDLRDLAAGIHSSLLTNRGLQAAVESLTHRAPVPVAVAIPDVRWPPVIETTAYFLVAEALANLAKHARATEAEVTVACDDETFTLTIADDGSGGADPRRGTGLSNLAERVAALDGVLAVVSPPGGPTTVTARIPLAQAAA